MSGGVCPGHSQLARIQGVRDMYNTVQTHPVPDQTIGGKTQGLARPLTTVVTLPRGGDHGWPIQVRAGLPNCKLGVAFVRVGPQISFISRPSHLTVDRSLVRDSSPCVPSAAKPAQLPGVLTLVHGRANTTVKKFPLSYLTALATASGTADNTISRDVRRWRALGDGVTMCFEWERRVDQRNK